MWSSGMTVITQQTLEVAQRVNDDFCCPKAENLGAVSESKSATAPRPSAFYDVQSKPSIRGGKTASYAP